MKDKSYSMSAGNWPSSLNDSHKSGEVVNVKNWSFTADKSGMLVLVFGYKMKVGTWSSGWRPNLRYTVNWGLADFCMALCAKFYNSSNVLMGSCVMLDGKGVREDLDQDVVFTFLKEYSNTFTIFVEKSSTYKFQFEIDYVCGNTASRGNDFYIFGGNGGVDLYTADAKIY